MEAYRMLKIKKAKLQIPNNRIAALLLLDVLSVLVSTFLAIYVRFDFKLTSIPQHYLDRAFSVLGINLFFMLLFFWLFRLYKSLWKFASANELLNIAGAVFSCAIVQFVVLIILQRPMPRSYYLFYGFSLFCFSCAIRFSYRILRIFNAKRVSYLDHGIQKNVMLIGAGASANTILKEIEASDYVKMRVTCVIDDDPNCHGRFIRGVPIVGDRTKIIESADKYEVDEIIVALPTASKYEVSKILEICKETSCKLRILPGMYQLINGEVSVSKLREVEIEDLLGREPIKVSLEEIGSYITNKIILVTGGGGSIGSELCRQLARYTPSLLLIFDIYENNAYEIQQELKRSYPDLEVKVLIGSIRDEQRVQGIFREYHPQIVYHAAAHKHVPLMEDSPNEAIKNNVFGTYTLAMAADNYEVEKFVMISTDKAVNPTNIMGASKRICEMIIQRINQSSKTEFVAVRFGNVLGSNGSVIPLFKKQIAEGGPVTVTHPEIIRYFMTIPEAVSLVLQAGAYAKGGEIFVLDMGAPVKILELAQNLIKLSGYKVQEEIPIIFTGLRAGEKMYEELLLNKEDLTKTENEMIFVEKPTSLKLENFEQELEQLRISCNENSSHIKELVAAMVETYKPE